MKNPHAVVPIDKMLPIDIERFWSFVDKTEDCWVWKAHLTKQGYGVFSFKDSPRVASRVSWFIENGSLPTNLLVCHRCDNPSCVNPKHLFLGTPKDNTEDGVKKGRINTAGSKNPFAKLNEKQVEEIREKYKPHQYKIKMLAEEYGVKEGTIESIVYGDRWKHMGGRALGSIKSKKKAKSSRENGKLGGRPKKLKLLEENVKI